MLEIIYHAGDFISTFNEIMQTTIDIHIPHLRVECIESLHEHHSGIEGRRAVVQDITTLINSYYTFTTREERLASP